MMFTDNPLADFATYDAEQEEVLSHCPVCADCGEHIQEDHFYLINDDCICPGCLERYYRKEVDDYAC